MDTTYDYLVKKLDNRKNYTEENNQVEIKKILKNRFILFSAIEALDNYKDLMAENKSFKTTGNMYNFKGINSFDSNIKALAIIYERSKDLFIESNIGIILEQVDFLNEHDFMDRFQEASIYLQKSFNTYEEGDVKFITYAFTFVKWGIINSYKKDNQIKFKDNVRYISNRIKELRIKLGYDNITANTISKYHNEFKHEDIEAALVFQKPMLSLNVNINNDEHKEAELIDSIEDENIIDIDEEIDKEILTKTIKEVISNTRYFNERDRKILTMRFGIELLDEYTLSEVGKQFSITRERVRQLESKALEVLKLKYKKELEIFI